MCFRKQKSTQTGILAYQNVTSKSTGSKQYGIITLTATYPTNRLIAPESQARPLQQQVSKQYRIGNYARWSWLEHGGQLTIKVADNYGPAGSFVTMNVAGPDRSGTGPVSFSADTLPTFCTRKVAATIQRTAVHIQQNDVFPCRFSLMTVARQTV